MGAIEEAKQVLKDNGYYVDNLWHIDDINQTYNCTDEEAIEVLDGALNTSYVVWNIFESIDLFAKNIGLTSKD